MGLNEDPASRAAGLARHYLSGLTTAPPPRSWTAPEFDDSDWLRAPGVDLVGERAALGKRAQLPDLPDPEHELLPYLRGADPFVKEVGLVCMRGKFAVRKRRQVQSLRLSITYRGGFVAYLNGKEVARASLPDGRLRPTTPAADYPATAFIEPKGRAANPYAAESPWLQRERKFGPVKIKRRHLRSGLNVLAIELRRSEVPAECKKRGIAFSPVGLAELSLKAEAPREAVASSVLHIPDFHVWPEPTWRPIHQHIVGDPVEMGIPVRIEAARNGVFAGQIVVSSSKTVRDLEVEPTLLRRATDGAAISADRIQIRYGAVNPQHSQGHFSWTTGLRSPRFDVLTDTPPTEVRTSAPEASGWGRIVRRSLGLPTDPSARAVIPIWLSIRVPKDAAAGRYVGSARVRAENSDPADVPIEMNVSDWALPDVKDYASLMFLYQSPDTLASYHEVEPWSEAHWRLIEASLARMGAVGNIGLIFSLIAESQMGNAESMVWWIREPDGTYRHDFTVFDRYLATALKHHHPDRLMVVSLNVWGWEVNRLEGGVLVTQLDPKTGKRSPMKLPEYGAPECEDLWRPVLLRAQEHLTKRRLARKVMFGIPADDADPHPAHVAMFRNILPEVPWHREAHFEKAAYVYDISDRSRKVRVGCTSLIWRVSLPDPRERRLYGWRYDPSHLSLNFNRFGTYQNLFDFAEPWEFRTWMETTLVCGRNGNGRVGADYYRITRGEGVFQGRDRWTGGCLFNRYPASNVHNLSLGVTTTDLFAPGPKGALSTARFENAIEGNQQAEARIVIEKALVERRDSLPDALARECQELLDERTNALRMRSVNYFGIWHDTRRGSTPFGAQNWQRSSRRLFELAGEVTKALKPRR